MSDIDQDPNRVAIAFIEYYYNLIHSGTENLYQLYSQNAVLRHGDYKAPLSADVVAAEGPAEIKAHWAKSKLAGSKVMIQSIDASKSFQESILIVCVGELAPKSSHDTESVAYKFVQTFLLVPTVKRSVYDVYNDVLNFLPDVDSNYDPEPESATETPDSAEKGEVFSVQSKESTPETGEGEEEEPEQPEQPEQRPERPVTSKPMSWADQIASAAAKKVEAKKTKESKELKEEKRERRDEKKEDEKKEDKKDKKEDEEFKKHKSRMVNKKGQVVYPIYVKGVTSAITEEELQKHLEENFGNVDLCKIDRMIALVNFTEQSSQKKAIKTGAIHVKGVEIKLEPRAKKDAAPVVAKKKRKGGKNGGVSEDGFRKVGK
ncbi:hypothetical protein KL911_001412 [Ogataea haglerorum]|uniref:uncharacterized protein n=1 Tax=Ogataea haglerorum TaxID=1937702 RepID=UPI001C8A88D1|nr:uncharacterized protein KL911_001412 [Ogataea haglerorum]KAG7751440.1 hypothetical protein KL912_000573 [Ogataea haglerorum]KAG7756610.1 hypothetical protein KL911_001412 [Ogataea haglerorum]